MLGRSPNLASTVKPSRNAMQDNLITWTFAATAMPVVIAAITAAMTLLIL